MRASWLLFPFGALVATGWTLWQSREWLGVCAEYVDRRGRCWNTPGYIAWNDTLTLAVIVLALSLAVAVLVRLRLRPQA
jgi:hypothetical protein